MMTLKYINVDGVVRINDGLQTYERARANIKTGAQIVYVLAIDYYKLHDTKELTCIAYPGVVLGCECDRCKIRLSSGDYTVFLFEIWERVQYMLRSVGHNVWYVAKLDESSKTWQPVSKLFNNFGDAKAWCDKRGIIYRRLNR